MVDLVAAMAIVVLIAEVFAASGCSHDGWRRWSGRIGRATSAASRDGEGSGLFATKSTCWTKKNTAWPVDKLDDFGAVVQTTFGPVSFPTRDGFQDVRCGSRIRALVS